MPTSQISGNGPPLNVQSDKMRGKVAYSVCGVRKNLFAAALSTLAITGCFRFETTRSANQVEAEPRPKIIYRLAPDERGAGNYEADSLDPRNWRNAAGAVLSVGYWVDQPTPYFMATEHERFILLSHHTSETAEVDTWMRNGYVFLRLTDEGKAIYFNHNGETPEGSLEIGIATGVTEENYQAGRFHPLWSSNQLTRVAPGYERQPTDGHRFTFGVEGMDIYARFKDAEFVRIQSWLHLAPGNVGLKANQGYGIRATSVRHGAEVVKTRYRSNFTAAAPVLDPRDFGLREARGIGSMVSGETTLRLQKGAGLFKPGDTLVVELGGEAGRGRHGTVGVGGVWPERHYAKREGMEADDQAPNGTYARLESDGSVFCRWGDEKGWEPVTKHYLSRANPLALRARVIEVEANGAILQLDQAAYTTTDDATVWLDNAPVLNALLNRPRHPALKPSEATVQLPAGHYALGEPLTIGRANWKLLGRGASQTRLFSPEGVTSARIVVQAAPDVEVADLHLAGNARDHGFGLDRYGPQSVGFPDGGVVFYNGSNRGLARDLLVSDVFQKAVGTSWSHDVVARRCRNLMTDGLRTYVQWQFQWADSTGGLIEDCVVESPTTLGGFEAFKSTGVHFVNCRGVNATLAMNTAGDFLIKDTTLVIRENSRDTAWFSEHNPVVNINTNIRGSGQEKLGGRIENIEIVIEGPVDADNNVFRGIAINAKNQDIQIVGAVYRAPDYQPPATVRPTAIRSQGANTLIDGFTAHGETGSEHTANIEVLNCATVRDTQAPRIRRLPH